MPILAPQTPTARPGRVRPGMDGLTRWGPRSRRRPSARSKSRARNFAPDAASRSLRSAARCRRDEARAPAQQHHDQGSRRRNEVSDTSVEPWRTGPGAGGIPKTRTASG